MQNTKPGLSLRRALHLGLGVGLVLLLAALVTTGPGRSEPSDAPSESERYGADVIGQPLPEWGDLRFLDTPHQRKQESFRGQILVIRFWTSGCPYCETSAPILSEWVERYQEDDVTILGIYHPKPPRRVSDETVRRLAKELGLDTMLAVDDDWEVLKKLWLRGKRRAFTSASLLVDRQGTVRAAHRGGNLTPEGVKEDRLAYRAFADTLDVLLADNKEPRP